jgi:signal transduction histidine kinase
VTVVPGALRTDARPDAPRTGATPIAQDMTAMIHRLVAGYSVVGLAPGLLELRAQVPGLTPGWLLTFCVGQTTVVLGMVVQAVRRRSIRGWAAAFAVLTLVAVLTFPWGAPSALAGPQPFLWWQVGLAVVCAGVSRGVGASVGYGLVLAAAWTFVRLTPSGGATGLTIAVAEGVFGVVAGSVIAVVARGMLDSAVSADARAAEVCAVELQQAIDKTLGEERARLDQMIHDDVMTTLTAATHSTDTTTGRATALLAHETLAVIDTLQSPAVDGSLSVSVLANLAEQTVRRVSPDVGFVDRVDARAGLHRVPSGVAESVLAALREAVRNAVRHAHAQTIEVELQAELLAGRLSVVARVVDDGRGFDLTTVPASRLGVRVSMLEASRRAGVRPRLRTAPGRGTELVLGWSGPSAERARVVPEPADTEDLLPVDFPTRQFVAATWLAVAVSVGVGLATFGRLASPVAVLLAMLVVLVSTWLVVAPSGSLRLPTGVAAVIAALQAVIAVLMVWAIPRYDQPDILYWQTFPAQLVMVVLVIRRRPGLAAVALLAFEAGVAWSCFTSGLGWGGLLRAGSGHVVFFGIAVLVTRVLRTISRRQVALRRQEDDALDEAARQHVARVQRGLWMSDLRAQARAILVRLSEATGPVPDGLRDEALLLEATLRESLVARNVMSDELAVLTEGARRRGVEVRLVDSRRTVVPPGIGQPLLDMVRRALAVESVSRLVVRLAPEDGATAASVLTEDAAGTHLVRIDASGALIATEVETRGP